MENGITEKEYLEITEIASKPYQPLPTVGEVSELIKRKKTEQISKQLNLF